MSEFSGTKELIFDTFIELTSTFGYENVSMRDIADKVGIKVASIYNHFETKATILESAYDYYTKRQYDNRKSVDEMKKMIETASADEMVTTFLYRFVSDDQKRYVRMILITKIIYMRLFQDPIANSIFAEQFENNAEHVIAVLKHGIEVGRLDSSFDIDTFADVLIGAVTIMGIRAFSGAVYKVGELEQAERILALHARLLSTALK